MDQAYELLEQGRVGMTTIMGMGGVFLALLCLYGFTTALGKLFSPRPAREKKPAAAPAETTPEKLKSKEKSGDPALAAAMAVAIAIQADSQRVLPLAVAAGPRFGPSPWKVAGRRALMRSPARSTTSQQG